MKLVLIHINLVDLSERDSEVGSTRYYRDNDMSNRFKWLVDVLMCDYNYTSQMLYSDCHASIK